MRVQLRMQACTRLRPAAPCVLGSLFLASSACFLSQGIPLITLPSNEGPIEDTSRHSLASCCSMCHWFPIFGFECLLPLSRNCSCANFENVIQASAEVWQRRHQGTYGAGYSAKR